jgi:hypothetical protein
MSEDTDKLNVIYNMYKDLFSQGYHNLLWQIMINEKHGEKVFTAAYTDSGLELVIACPEGGYISAMCIFNDNISYNKANDYAEDISKSVFSIDKNEVLNRVNASFSYK